MPRLLTWRARRAEHRDQRGDNDMPQTGSDQPQSAADDLRRQTGAQSKEPSASSEGDSSGGSNPDNIVKPGMAATQRTPGAEQQRR